MRGRLGKVAASLVASVLLALPAGVSVAMAEPGVMCKAGEAKCSEANRYPVETKFTAVHLTSMNAILEGWDWRTYCKESTLSGASTSATTGELTSWTFSSCTPLKLPGYPECTGAEALNLPYTVEFLTNEEGLEKLRLSAGENGEPSLKFTCHLGNFPFSCTESAEEVEVRFVGGESAEIWAEEALMHLAAWSNEIVCKQHLLDTKWYGAYEVTSPSPLFLRP